MSARYLTLKITPELAGLEVNTLLRRALGLSGTVLRRIKWLEDGITLDGARVNVRVRVEAGQTLSVRLTDPAPTSGVVPAEGPLDIVYEDPDLVVLNKAPGVLVHPGHGHFDDTLGNFLMWHYQQAGDESDFHPVHRLDKGTSGLVVIAKHAHAQEKLKNQLHTNEFHRVYLAVCDGAPPAPAGTVDAPIGPAGGSLTAREARPNGSSPAHTGTNAAIGPAEGFLTARRVRPDGFLPTHTGTNAAIGPAEGFLTARRVRPDGFLPAHTGTNAAIGPAEGFLTARRVRPDGKPARTHYRVVQARGPRTLVELELETGRTHQIRVHMAHLGCPLTGDFLYGTENRALIARPALHSARLELTHPITGERLAFSVPLPADMAALMTKEDLL